MILNFKFPYIQKTVAQKKTRNEVNLQYALFENAITKHLP